MDNTTTTDTIGSLLDHLDESYGVIVTDYDEIDEKLRELNLTRTESVADCGLTATELLDELDGCGLILTDEDDLNTELQNMGLQL